MTMIKTGAIMGLCGALLNRLNISVIAFKWNAPVHYVPSWMEIVVSASVICAEIWVFRWVVMRMPILADDTHEVARPSTAAAVAQRLAS
jgi:hypothetical protein